MKFEKFEIGDEVISFTNEDKEFRLKQYADNAYTLQCYDPNGRGYNWKTCYESTKNEHNACSIMNYRMPTNKAAFKAKARRMVQKISHLG